ncbi:MAG: outer membrane protein assembly factor BamC [Methylobacter sp.]|nr:MAG: outer membrane protein assembly factor BamC [Methylobacter sp.]
MKAKFRSLIIVAALVNVSACSTIKNLFPDKEKDYQFTTEIPPLVLPPDLVGDSIAKVPAAAATPVAETAETAETTEAVAPTAPAIDRKLIQVELLDADQGSKRLHISAPSTIAWRMVGKALSRKSIEVTNRNQDEGLFHVQYDPNKQDVEDGSFWDEITFVIKGFEVTEQEYVLKLVENNRQTDVIIMDKEQKPVTDEASLSLLTLLHNTIKADLAK